MCFDVAGRRNASMISPAKRLARTKGPPGEDFEEALGETEMSPSGEHLEAAKTA